MTLNNLGLNLISGGSYKIENIPLNKTHIGLSNIDNTSDINKPISTLTQAALNQKESQTVFNLTLLQNWTPSVSTPVVNTWTFNKPKFSGVFMYIIASSGQTGSDTATIKTVCLSYDISNVSATQAPVKLGEILVFSGTGYAGTNSPSLRGTWLVDSCKNSKAYCINIGNPRNMSVILLTAPSSQYYCADIRGRYLYCSRTSNIIDVYDMFAPIPSLISSLTGLGFSGFTGFQPTFKIFGDILYWFGSNNMTQVNVNVQPPVILGTFGSAGTAIDVSGDFLYLGIFDGVAGSKVQRYRIFSNGQSAPVLDTSFGTNGVFTFNIANDAVNDQCDDVEIVNNRMYIVGRTDYRVYVYDLTQNLNVSTSVKTIETNLYNVSVSSKNMFCSNLTGSFSIYALQFKNYDNAVIGDLTTTRLNTMNMNVQDFVNVGGSLSVSGSFRVDDNVLIDGSMKLDGDVDITGSLKVPSIKTTALSGIDLSDSNLSLKILNVEQANLSSGGLNITGGLTIGGNLTVNGTNTILNTQTITVDDPIIRFADNNTVDILDTGFYAVQDTNKYSGLIRKASNDTWYLTEKHSFEPVAGIDYTTNLGDLTLRKLLWAELSMNTNYQNILGPVGTPMIVLNAGNGLDGNQNIEMRHHLYITDPVFPTQVLSLGRGSGLDVNNFQIVRNSTLNTTDIGSSGVTHMTLENTKMTISKPLFVQSTVDTQGISFYNGISNFSIGVSGFGSISAASVPMYVFSSGNGVPANIYNEFNRKIQITDNTVGSSVFLMGINATDVNRFEIEYNNVSNLTTIKNGGVNMLNFNQATHISSPVYVLPKQLYYRVRAATSSSVPLVSNVARFLNVNTSTPVGFDQTSTDFVVETFLVNAINHWGIRLTNDKLIDRYFKVDVNSAFSLSGGSLLDMNLCLYTKTAPFTITKQSGYNELTRMEWAYSNNRPFPYSSQALFKFTDTTRVMMVEILSDTTRTMTLDSLIIQLTSI
jgi:hypothetical protein